VTSRDAPEPARARRRRTGRGSRAADGATSDRPRARPPRAHRRSRRDGAVGRSPESILVPTSPMRTLQRFRVLPDRAAIELR